MPSDVAVYNPSPVMANNKEAVQQLERDRGDGQKVHGRDRFAMIVKKSPPAWASSGSLGARFIQREMLRSDTSKPSMSRSPWMRGAPQVGFSAAMPKIRSRSSREILLLPACFLLLESMLQYMRKPAPCQPTTVSGATTSSDFFQAHQNRRARTQLCHRLGPD